MHQSANNPHHNLPLTPMSSTLNIIYLYNFLKVTQDTFFCFPFRLALTYKLILRGKLAAQRPVSPLKNYFNVNGNMDIYKTNDYNVTIH